MDVEKLIGEIAAKHQVRLGNHRIGEWAPVSTRDAERQGMPVIDAALSVQGRGDRYLQLLGQRRHFLPCARH